MKASVVRKEIGSELDFYIENRNRYKDKFAIVGAIRLSRLSLPCVQLLLFGSGHMGRQEEGRMLRS